MSSLELSMVGQSPAIRPLQTPAIDVALRGFPDTWPIAQVGSQWLGLQARWGADFEASPVVLMEPQTGEYSTVAESLDLFVPVWLIRGLYGTSEAAWDNALAQAETLQAVHRQLGGQDRWLQVALDFIADGTAREYGCEGPEHLDLGIEFDELLGEAFAGSAFGAYASFVAAVDAMEPREAPDLASLGSWGPLASYAHTHNTYGMDPSKPFVSAEQVVQALQSAMMLPLGAEANRTLPSVFGGTLVGDARKGVGPTWQVARLLEDHSGAYENEPLARALRQLAQQGSAASGVELGQAAVELAAQGRFEAALSLARSMVFLQRAHFGTVPGDVLAAYRQLVVESGSTSHLRILERFAASGQSV